jgi:LysM repeat protein
MERAAIFALAGLLCLASAPVHAQSLRGSPQAMQVQNRIAKQHDYTFLRTGAQVRQFVAAGYLVKLPGNADYQLAAVSYPYARPAVKTFVERLSAQYRAACGERLVVTSLTRPVREQPRNASALSVHPAGMAVDLRVSGRSQCRSWLERTLLSLERQGVLNAIRENRPPHYHVALFPNQYTQYVARLTRNQPATRLASAERAPAPAASSSRAAASRTTSGAASAGPSAPVAVAETGTAAAGPSDAAPAREGTQSAAQAIAAELADSEHTLQRYRINRGDSLWSIARRHGTTVETLKALNGLDSSSIVAGQFVLVPTSAPADASPEP